MHVQTHTNTHMRNYAKYTHANIRTCSLKDSKHSRTEFVGLAKFYVAPVTSMRQRMKSFNGAAIVIVQEIWVLYIVYYEQAEAV